MHGNAPPVPGASASARIEQMMRGAGSAEHAARAFRGRQRAASQCERHGIGAGDKPWCAAPTWADSALFAEIDEDMLKPP